MSTPGARVAVQLMAREKEDAFAHALKAAGKKSNLRIDNFPCSKDLSMVMEQFTLLDTRPLRSGTCSDLFLWRRRSGAACSTVPIINDSSSSTPEPAPITSTVAELLPHARALSGHWALRWCSSLSGAKTRAGWLLLK